MPRPGDIITVRGGFGTEAPLRGFVTDVGEEMGRPVVDYIDANGRGRWAYLDQIEEDPMPRRVVLGDAA